MPRKGTDNVGEIARLGGTPLVVAENSISALLASSTSKTSSKAAWKTVLLRLGAGRKFAPS